MIVGGAANRTRDASPSGTTDSIDAVPSTCPCTTCPPNRPFAASDRSRFTGSPTSKEPSVVRRRVSGTTSTLNPESLRRVTVRHTPLTAMLSPNPRSPSTSDAPTESPPPPAASTRPTSSTIPVNMAYSSLL